MSRLRANKVLMLGCEKIGNRSSGGSGGSQRTRSAFPGEMIWTTSPMCSSIAAWSFATMGTWRQGGKAHFRVVCSKAAGSTLRLVALAFRMERDRFARHLRNASLKDCKYVIGGQVLDLGDCASIPEIGEVLALFRDACNVRPEQRDGLSIGISDTAVE